MSEASNGDSDLLTSPLAGARVGKLFVIGGPIALAIAIVASLWVSYLHVRFTAVVQAPAALVSGQPFALRTEVVPEGSAPLPPLAGSAWVEQGGQRHDLGALTPAGDGGVLQATAQAPALSVGAATLHVRMESASGEGMEPMEEAIEVSVVDAAPTLKAAPLVAGSTLQHGDDSDPQPPRVRISVRPHGRLLSEFENTIYVRVLHPDGRPFSGEVEVSLISGAFADARPADGVKPVLGRGALDALGLFSIHGRLESAVLRVKVAVLGPDGTPLHERTVRMVSFAGGVVLRPDALAVSATGPELDLVVEALRRKRPVFVDVHAPGGAWVSTVTPPLKVGEPPRSWTHGPVAPGVLQFEAYAATNAPGESAALARVQVVQGDPTAAASLVPLLQLHREGVDAPRVEAGYEASLETKFLDRVQALPLDAEAVRAARRFLLGTLPLATYEPPVAVANRDRVLEAMATKKRRWTVAMRWVLLGGGGLFLLLMTLTMMRGHAQAAASTMAALGTISDDDERHEASATVAAAKRAALLRGLGVVAVMAAALAGTTLLLESLLWAH